MIRILDRTFWDKGVPTIRALEKIGMRTSATRFNSMDFNVSLASYTIRSEFVRMFGFAVPSREVLERIATLSKSIVEIGAGSGFFALQLARFGVDVLSTDLKCQDNPYKFPVGAYYPVASFEASDAVLKHPDRDVLTVWPDYEGNWAYKAAKKMQPGRLLFYIGEGHGGCTADDQFHELLDDPNEFEEVESVLMAQFFGINDNLMIYRRRAGVLAIV